MRKLERNEMRSIKGGIYYGPGGTVINLVGFSGPDASGNCWCDVCSVGAPMNIACGQWCPASACSQASMDPNAWCTNGGTPPGTGESN